MASEDQAGKLRRYARVGEVFTPGAPVDRFALFAGRTPQIMSVVDAINQRGQHVVLYGERGVGKTSLANILAEVFWVQETGRPLWAVKVNCTTQESEPAVSQLPSATIGRLPSTSETAPEKSS